MARNIRENYICGGIGCRTASTYNIALAVGIVPEMLVEAIELWNRLADLIGPGEDPTEQGIDSIYDWCFSGLEGADEDELYCAIMRAIEDYRHPERVTARTARAVDREALLALADKIVADTEEDVSSEDLVPSWYAGETLRDVASKIREACGVIA